MTIDKGTVLPITQLSGLQINYKDANSTLNPPVMNTKERGKLVNTDDKANPVKKGTIIYNNETDKTQIFQNRAWISVGDGNGDVVGPAVAVSGNLASFDDTSGKLIKDSGIAAIPINKLPFGQLRANPLYQLTNLGAIAFGNNDNIADTAVILLDSLTPITFQTQGTGVNSQVCTIINGELGAGSSSASALLEINSTTGGFLNSRINTQQMNALDSPVDGTIVYNTDTNTINSRQNGAWVSLGTEGEGTVTSVGLTNSDNNFTIEGSPITSSGSIDINLNPNLTGLTSIGTNTVKLTANGNSIGLTAAAGLSSNLNFVFPSTSGIAGQILSTDGTGKTGWVNAGGGGTGTVTSVGLTNSDNNFTITGSPITSSGSIAINLNNNVNIYNLNITNSITAKDIATTSVTFRLNTYLAKILPPSSPINNTIFVLPNSNGTNGQILSTDGNGNTNWIVNSGASGAPGNAQYILNSANANLPNSIVLPIINSGVYSSSIPGSGNLYIGTSSGSFGSATHDNLGIGYGTLDFLSNNSAYNIAIGPQALQRASNSIGNTVIGYQSMFALTTDSIGTYYNTAIGYQTFNLLSNPTSSGASIQNTAVGYQSGSKQSSYRMCTFLGALTDASAGLMLGTAIGCGTIVKANYAIALTSEENPGPVGIGIGAPQYSLHVGNVNPSGGGLNSLHCGILLSKTNQTPPIPTGQYDVALWAQKGDSNGALFFRSNTGGIYKIDSTMVGNPAQEPKIPVLSYEEIQALDNPAIGAIVYDITNDKVIIRTASKWMSFLLGEYN